MSSSTWSLLRQPETDETRLWELFHENSMVSPHDTPVPTDHVLARMEEMHQSLPYEGLPGFELPEPDADIRMSVQEAILKRRTARELAARPLSLGTLASLLSLAYGVTSPNTDSVFARPFRAVPSGGALYPLEIYFHSVQIEGLPPGLFHYNPMTHGLRLLREGDLSRQIAQSLVQTETPYQSSLVLFITAMFERSTFKYGERGYRFALLEAGHVAQNLNLAAVAMGLGVRSIGGFLDRRIDRLLDLDGCSHSTVYMVAIGDLVDDGTGPAGTPD